MTNECFVLSVSFWASCSCIRHLTTLSHVYLASNRRDFFLHERFEKVVIGLLIFG